MTSRKSKAALTLASIASVVVVALSGCNMLPAPGAVPAQAENAEVGVNEVEVDETFVLEVEQILPINNEGEVVATCNRPAGSGVMLSFDDSGSPEQVQAILNVLAELNWRAAFFPIGEWATTNWELIRLIQQEGHIVGNHTMTHPDLVEVFATNPDQFYGEVYPLKDMATTYPMLLRPPFGSGIDDPQIVELLTERDYQLCGWTADTNDWRGGTAEEMLQRVMDGYEYSPEPLQPDGIVLAHMQGEHSVDFVRLLAAELDQRGWERDTLR